MSVKASEVTAVRELVAKSLKDIYDGGKVSINANEIIGVVDDARIGSGVSDVAALPPALREAYDIALDFPDEMFNLVELFQKVSSAV